MQAAYGPGPILVLCVFVITVMISQAVSILRRKLSPRGDPHTVLSFLIVILLLLPEILFFVLNPNSPKYILLSSILLSGLVVILPVRYLQSSLSHPTRPLAQGLLAAVPLVIIGVLFIFSARIHFREILTNDGNRYIGSHLRMRASPHPDSLKAEQLFVLLDTKPETFRQSLVIRRPYWILQQSIAYQAFIRGWRNQVVPAASFRTHASGEPMSYFGLNEYTNPSGTVRIYVPADSAAVGNPEMFTDLAFAHMDQDYLLFYEGGDFSISAVP
jgi:hypothetical protein